MSRRTRHGRPAPGSDRPGGPAPRIRGQAVWPVVVAFGLLTAGLGLLTWTFGGYQHHPSPRDGTALEEARSRVLSSARPGDEDLYRAVALVPRIADGLRCYCGCASREGHRSLLVCFETGHAAASELCRLEAGLAYTRAGQGAGLRAVRAAVEDAFGR